MTEESPSSSPSDFKDTILLRLPIPYHTGSVVTVSSYTLVSKISTLGLPNTRGPRPCLVSSREEFMSEGRCP